MVGWGGGGNGRSTARTLRLLMLLVVILAAVVGLASAQESPAAGTCDWGSTVADPLIQLSDAPSAQRCGVEALENEAYDLYASSHGMSAGDARLTSYAAQVKIAGIMWALFLQVIGGEQEHASLLTTDQANAYAWLHSLVSTFDVTAAQDSIDEYNKWSVDPCSYRTPNEHLYTYYDECTDSMSNLFSGPSPPSYQELIEIGRYDAAQTLHMNDSLQGSKYQLLEDEQILEAQASWSAMLIGAVGPIINAVNPLLVAQWLRLVTPHASLDGSGKSSGNNTMKKFVDKMEKEQGELEDVEEAEVLEEGGEAADPALEEGASVALDESVDAGLDLASTAVEFGSASITAPLMAVGFAAAIAIQEGIKVFNDAKIPGQLADNLATVKSESLATMIVSPGSTGGFSEIEHDFEAELLLPDPSTGTSGNVVNTPPSDGTELRIEHVDDAGTTRFTELTQTAKLAVWPLGIDKGEYGVPQEQIAYYDGQLWRQIGARSDDARAGLSGWVPTGELHYFDWSGHPRIAIVQGDQFLTLPSPGSIDVGGNDAGGDCSTDGACTVTDTLPVLLSAGGVDPSYSSTVVTNAGFTEARTYHASDGTVTAPFQRARLTIEPNTGAPALIEVDNQFGKTANTGTNTALLEGGLHADDTVTLLDPLAHPLGYATTYKWEVETRCAHDPDHPEHTLQGVPVCYGSSAYNLVYAPDYDDLSSGCPICTEDPAFHGNPVEVHTGPSMSFTWPAPGVYHVRLITTDSFGVEHQADVDETVSGTAPTLSLSSSAGTLGAGVYGPAANGDPFTITGCLTNPTAAYVEPTVKVDWDDGADTERAYSGGNDTLSFQEGPTDDCAGPWQFTATHTYDLGNVGYAVQKQLHITVSDDFGDSTTFALSVEVRTPSAPPSFDSPDHATFTVGSGSNSFEVQASPPDTTSLSVVAGTLPAGLAFTPLPDGKGTIEGAPSSAEGGTYPLTLRGTNDSGSVDQSFTLTIADPPAITSPATTTLARGQAATVNVTTTGSPTPTVAIAGSLPPGLTATSNGDGTATLGGTPTSDGTYDLTVTATSDVGSTVQHLVISVGDAPVFVSGTRASFVVGASASSFAVVASGATAYSCEAPCSFPSGSGLAFHDAGDGSAAIFGAAAAAGTSTITIDATNAFGSATQQVTVDASSTGGPALTFSGDHYDSPSHVAGFTIGTAGTLDIATDAGAAISISGNLPDGLAFTDAGDGTGTISGTPAAGSGGWYALVVTAHPDDGGTDGFAFVELEVVGPPSMASPSTAVFTEGSAGSFTVRASGLPRANITAADSLPDGLSLTGGDDNDGTATISGTPAAGTSGRHTITLHLANLLGDTAATLTIEIDAAPAVTSAATAHLGEGATSSFTVTTSGYPAPALSVLGDLPPGIAFADNGDGTGTFSGTATDTTLASYPVTVAASSTAGTATQALTLAVGPVPAFTSPDHAAFAVGTNGSFTLSSGTDPTPAFSVDSAHLPAGLAFADGGDGTATISGTPAAGSGGLVTVPVTATNAYGTTTQNVTLTVAEAPTFLGEGTDDCSRTFGVEDPAQFGAGTDQTWLLCTSGYPTPVLTLAGPLPDGVTFTDGKDGSATISGSPATGSGGTYPLTLTLANGAGSTTETLHLEVDERVHSLAESDDPVFIAGQPNTYTIATAAYPAPQFSVDLPGYDDWLSAVDNGDGTVTLSGTPPLSLLDSDDPEDREVDGDWEAAQPPLGGISFGEFTVDVAALGFTAAAPPAPVVGEPYSYTFATNDPNATFALADGDTVPDGLSLSSSGVLSGTPTSVGSWSLSVVATDGTDTVSTQPLVLTVAGASHALEISAFRLYGPAGRSDWYVTARNTTDAALQAYGWKVAVFLRGSTTPIEEPLPFTWLAPGGEVTVAGPNFSLQPLVPVDEFGPPVVAVPGGFELVAPDGTVADRAGLAGADSQAVEGAGVSVPADEQTATQSAFVRRSTDGVLADTGDNADDFTYSSQVRSQSLVFASTPPEQATVGSTYDVVAAGGASTSPVEVSVAASSEPGACSLDGTTVTFTGGGTCVIEATQDGDLDYAAAPAIFQSIEVLTASSPATSTATATAPAQPSATSLTNATAVYFPTAPAALTVGTGDEKVEVSVPIGAVAAPARFAASVVDTLHGVTFAVGTVAVQLTATASSGTRVTHFDQPVELVFPAPGPGFVPAFSSNGETWTSIPALGRAEALPAGWPDGWYLDSAGLVHVFTRHATYFAMLGAGSHTKAAFQLRYGVKRSLNLNYGHRLTVHVQSTLPSQLVVSLLRGSKKLGSWRRTLGTDAQALRIVLPKAARHRGKLKLTVAATAGAERSAHTVTLKLLARWKK
jgi:hypothetical protein